jgi:pyridoxine 5-phosphate synthase
VVVSAFIDPQAAQVAAAAAAGCQAIELHTGAYANACLAGNSTQDQRKQADLLAELGKGMDSGLDAGLIVHAGHGLTYANVAPLAAMKGFTEFNIGHAIISRAVFVGIRQAVAEMKNLLSKEGPRS